VNIEEDNRNLSIGLQQLEGVLCPARRAASVHEVIFGIKPGQRSLISGVAGSSLAFLLASLNDGPVLVVADDADDAGYMYNDLCQITGGAGIYCFPSGYRRDIRFGQPDAPSRILRTEVLNALGGGMARIVVTSPEALAERVASPEILDENRLRLEVGQRLKITDVCARLADLDFQKTDYVYEPGQYARRGSIVDVFSYSSEDPVRIDFFDDEIDSIRLFNVETQLSECKQKIIVVTGAAGGACDAGYVSLLQYLGPKVPLLCRSEAPVLGSVKKICSSRMSASALLAASTGDVTDLEALKELIDADVFEQMWQQHPRVEMHAMPVDLKRQKEYAAVMQMDTTPQSAFHKNFDLIEQCLEGYISGNYKIYILSDSEKQVERLRSIFADRRSGISFTPVQGTVHSGFSDNAIKVCVFTDHQIFDRYHRYSLRSDKARGGRMALSLKELNNIEIGDYVVHTDHGVGRFGGLVRTDVGGATQEMVKLIYDNDDLLFVSIHSLHKLAKFRSKDGVPPKVNRLGSGAWNRLKEKTKSKLKDVARDLIQLYAKRCEEKGFAFSPDSYMQHELEASFIYEDTPDQLKATQAVKADMESARPMDRLICGDVGFGKTEIAVRAAFKAAADNKQTAVLVPTTVLALQHYHTFKERLKDFPVRVDFLSRARKPKEVKQLLADLAEGKIDVLIGTHKLVGKAVKFKDLGLLVIDEEQKFGVAVKEKLKQLKVNVDTLTMSATPIPRTLQFSLMGARDLSNINTPPPNRHPIMTSVVPMGDDVVREAVNFELSRGGQVFFVSNRVERLGTLKNMLNRLVPDARVAVGHGQMGPSELEQIIYDFAHQDYDVLLCTTIMESGIDMPNVNTILVDSAQNFGLSELHQLRGRVGRSNRKAFAYMLIPGWDAISAVSQRRLRAIESFSDLGAGINIAMQDLDIRGAGNLLGAEQSGFIADLGYETYRKVLTEAVTEIKTQEFADTFSDLNLAQEVEYIPETVIETDMELLIPATYVPQEGERISLYQELDSMDTDAQAAEFLERLQDRFGRVPPETTDLVRIVTLRRLARRSGIERLLLRQGRMFMYFPSDANEAYYRSPAFGRVLSYISRNPGRTNLRQKGDKRSIVVDGVSTVGEAVNILTEVGSMEAI